MNGDLPTESPTSRGNSEPNPSVYEAHPSFICGSGGCLITMNNIARPEHEIAGNLLEEMCSWVSALQEQEAPQRVLFAMRAALAAAEWWVDELDKPRPRGERADGA